MPALVCWRTGPRRCQWHGCLSALLRSLRRVYGGRARHRSARPARRQDSAEKRVPPSPLPIPSYRDEPAPNPSHHHDDPRGGGRATGLTFGQGPLRILSHGLGWVPLMLGLGPGHLRGSDEARPAASESASTRRLASVHTSPLVASCPIPGRRASETRRPGAHCQWHPPRQTPLRACCPGNAPGGPLPSQVGAWSRSSHPS